MVAISRYIVAHRSKSKPITPAENGLVQVRLPEPVLKAVREAAAADMRSVASFLKKMIYEKFGFNEEGTR